MNLYYIIIGIILLYASLICTEETENLGVCIAGIIVMFLSGFIVAKGLGV